MNAADGDVVRAIRGGDRNAYGALVDRYQGRLFGLALMMLRERTAAEEITQDAFVRAYRHLSRYDVERPFYPWLASIAVRLAQNRLRERGRIVAREGTRLDDAPEPHATGGALDGLIVKEGTQALWTAVSALSSAERTAVYLYYRDGMRVDEVARALGVTGGTIKTLLFRARRHLRERLTADENVTGTSQ